MTLIADLVKATKERAVAVLSTAAVGVVMAACVAGYEVGKNVALKSWVISHVDERFATRDRIAEMRDDISELENIRDKSEDETVVADLTDRINDLKSRLSTLIDDGQVDQIRD